MVKSRSTKAIRTTCFLAILGGAMFAFQNCGPAFQLAGETSSSEGSTGSKKMNPFTCSAPGGQSVSSIRRLSKAQYANTLQDLLGGAAFAQIQPTVATLPSDEMKLSVNDIQKVISDTQMTAYQNVAEAVYNQVLASSSLAQSIGGACIVQATVTSACRDDFIRNFGLRAFRRPLSAEEVGRWGAQVFALGESSLDRVGLVVYGMLMSPNFLLKPEIGTEPADADTFALSPFELASRLSYDLTDGPPDAELMAAATANKLSSRAELAAHVDRLVSSARGRAKIRAFFVYWLNPQRYSAASFAADFLQGVDVVQLNDEFEREMFEYLDYMVFTKKASLEDLLTSRESFARGPAAEVYGHVPHVPNGPPAIMSAERKGLLMRGPVIATEGNETHPIVRGVKIRTRFLCETMGLPSGVMTNDPTFFSDEARALHSTRFRTDGLTSQGACVGCHRLINPPGFAFENFDGLGRVRAVERAYSVQGAFLAEHEIRTDSSNVLLGNVQSVNISNGLDVVDRMLEANTMPGCFVRQAHRFYKAQLESAEDDGCALSSSYQKLMVENSEAPLLEMFKSAYLHDSVFRRRMK